MPMLRERGGTWTPSAGADTTRPPILTRPAVGCSRPAMQRSVVVLPQPEGPSSTTISPAGTWKLTPSTAGRPMANCLRRSRTSREADMRASEPFRIELSASLPVTVNLVPILDPGCVQFYVLIKVWQPDLHHLRIKTFWIDRRLPQRGKVSKLLDHEGLAFRRQAPVEEQLRCVGVLRRRRHAAGIRIDRRAFGRKEDLERGAIPLLGIDDVV